jgi:hypothetical protein
MSRPTLIFSLAMALIFSTVQCAAACVSAPVSQESVPPCHRHHAPAPAPCSHHILSVASAPSEQVTVAIVVPANVDTAFTAVSWFPSELAQSVPEFGPPGRTLPSTVLRV